MSIDLVVEQRRKPVERGGISVRLLGGFEMRAGDRVHALDKRKACAIIAYLLMSGQSRETRGRLCALLWSEKDEKRARDSLRQSIRDLKTMEAELGVRFVSTDKLSIGIDRSVLDADILAVERALDARDHAGLDRILARGCQAFCVGLQDCDPAFDNWTAMKSVQWTDMVTQRLADSLDLPGTGTADRKAIAACILRLDPFHELAVKEMLRALGREGGYPRARAFFERYAAELREDLDLGPPSEIVRAMERIKADALEGATGGGPGPEAENPAPLVERPTILLVTGKAADAYAHTQFALVSELCASLSRFRHWTAIHAEVDPGIIDGGTIAELRAATSENADLAVLITAVRDGAELSFDISCIDFIAGRKHFSTIAPSAPSEWRTVFNEICAHVASRLQRAISTTRLHRIDRQSPNYVSAYDCWLDGQRLTMLWRNETHATAVERYEDAIRQDPGLACAYSGLAAILNSRWFQLPGYPMQEPDLARAFELARKAVALDPLDHRNQVNLAWSHLLAHRWELAEFHFGLAHDLNAANPATLTAYALASAFMGNHERAVALARRSFELNPVHEAHYHGYHATVAFLAGDLDTCISAVEASDGLFPDIRGWSAAAHALRDDERRAAADFRLFAESVAAAWYGGDRPDRQTLVDWFSSIFPLRREADRRRLADGIERAARWA